MKRQMKPVKLLPAREAYPDQKCACGVKWDKFHRWGCDYEECPFCFQQLVQCNCCYIFLELNCNLEPVHSRGLIDRQEREWRRILRKRGRIPNGEETRFQNP